MLAPCLHPGPVDFDPVGQVVFVGPFCFNFNKLSKVALSDTWRSAGDLVSAPTSASGSTVREI